MWTMGVIRDFIARNPFLKAAAAYAVLWPTENILHQRREGRDKYDFKEALGYGMVGVCAVCPVFYIWIKTINKVVPGTNFNAVIKKVLCEQTLYWPVAISVFFGAMNYYEGHDFERFKHEMETRYVKTHMAGLCFWPIASPIINYSGLVKDTNRTPVAAVASFIWASYLSHVRDEEQKRLQIEKEVKDEIVKDIDAIKKAVKKQ